MKNKDLIIKKRVSPKLPGGGGTESGTAHGSKSRNEVEQNGKPFFQ